MKANIIDIIVINNGILLRIIIQKKFKNSYLYYL
jgi:hypothetical protein